MASAVLLTHLRKLLPETEATESFGALELSRGQRFAEHSRPVQAARDGGRPRIAEGRAARLRRIKVTETGPQCATKQLG